MESRTGAGYCLGRQPKELDPWEAAPEEDLYCGQLDWRRIVSDRDRQWFAFVWSGGEKNHDIYVANTSDRMDRAVRLTSDLAVDSHPRWSPDGRHIAFVSGRTGEGDIYLIEDVGKILGKKNKTVPEPERITFTSRHEMSPEWSPDGEYIAFAGYTEQGDYDIFVLHVPRRDELDPTNITGTEGIDEVFPSWSPSGDRMAFYVWEDAYQRDGDDIDNAHIGVVPIDATGGTVRAGEISPSVTSHFLAREVVPSLDRGPQWAPLDPEDPTARYIAYVQNDPPRYNPIVLAREDMWEVGKLEYSRVLPSNTKINMDVSWLPLCPGVVFAHQDGNRQVVSVLRGSKLMPHYQEKPRIERRVKLHLMFLPGLNSLRMGDTRKGLLRVAGEIGVASLWYMLSRRADRSFDEAQVALDAYHAAGSPDLAEAAFQEAQRRYDRATSHAEQADLALAGLAGLVFWGLWEDLAQHWQGEATIKEGDSPCGSKSPRLSFRAEPEGTFYLAASWELP